VSLQNLLKIGRLEEHEPNAEQVRRMLDSAKRSIADARQESISLETRLDAAYRAITLFEESKNKPDTFFTFARLTFS
jgi:hypothetical protein